jgi:hypothetical protein
MNYAMRQATTFAIASFAFLCSAAAATAAPAQYLRLFELQISPIAADLVLVGG